MACHWHERCNFRSSSAPRKIRLQVSFVEDWLSDVYIPVSGAKRLQTDERFRHWWAVTTSCSWRPRCGANLLTSEATKACLLRWRWQGEAYSLRLQGLIFALAQTLHCKLQPVDTVQRAPIIDQR